MLENLLILIGFFLALTPVSRADLSISGVSREVGLTASEKQALLDEHNVLRTLQAQGQVPGQPSAADMVRLVSCRGRGWDARRVADRGPLCACRSGATRRRSTRRHGRTTAAGLCTATTRSSGRARTTPVTGIEASCCAGEWGPAPKARRGLTVGNAKNRLSFWASDLYKQPFEA